MKRLPILRRGPLGTGTARSTPALWAAAGLLLTALLTLSRCAGTPQAGEELLSPQETVRIVGEAWDLLALGTPPALEGASAALKRQGLPPSVAAEPAELAGRLFGLLYPELQGSVAFAPQQAYGDAFEDRYGAVLNNAARALPPPAGWVPPEQTGEPAGTQTPTRRRTGGARSTAGADLRQVSFFNRIMPALYLVHLEGAAASPSDPAAAASAAAIRALEEALEAARAQNPGSVLPPYLLGRTAELTGRPGAAERQYRECLRVYEPFYPARQRLAALYLAQDRPAAAAEELEGVRSALPQEPAVRDSLIEAYFAAAAPAQASPLVAEALIENPDSRQHLYLRARILLEEGDWVRALQPLALLRRHHPDAREGYLLAARIHFEQARDLERALEVLGEAEGRFPEDAEIPELAGAMLVEAAVTEDTVTEDTVTEDTVADTLSDRGLERLRRALELEPERLSAMSLIAAEAMRLGRWNLADRHLKEILAREQRIPDLRNAYTVSARLGDRPRALEYAQELFRLEPGDAARLRHAEALLAAGRSEEARALIDQGLPPSAEAALRSSLLYLQARLEEQADPERALVTLKRALVADPDNGQALRRLAELYLQGGQAHEALLFFRAAARKDPGDGALKLQLEALEAALEDRKPSPTDPGR